MSYNFRNFQKAIKNPRMKFQVHKDRRYSAGISLKPGYN